MNNSDFIYQCKSPVSIILFNRIEETRQLLIALSLVRPNVVFVISDGPRSSVSSDYQKVQACRSLVDELIFWDCNVVKIYSDFNLGCMRRVVTGLDLVFNNCNESIILEDDCIPSINFFKFCDWALKDFEFNENIGMVSGSNLVSDLFDIDFRNGFSKYISIWGWATWKRVWSKYDHHLTIMDVQINSNKFSPNKYWENLFWKELFKLSINSSKIWDFRLQYVFFYFQLFSIYPKFNLVNNVGFGVDATHTSIDIPDFVNLNIPDKEIDIYDFTPCTQVMVSENRDTIYLRRIWGFSIYSTIKLKLGNLIRFSK